MADALQQNPETDRIPAVPVTVRRARLFALWHQERRALAARSRIADMPLHEVTGQSLQRAALRSLRAEGHAPG